MGKYIMALDQGTTSSRTILFDKKGNIVCQANKEFEQIFPKPGWVEHNPEEIWMTQLLTMEDVMRQAGITGKDIESPIPLNLWIQILPVNENEAKMKVTIRAEVNMFMKAMVAKPLQEGVEKLADMLSMIPY